MTASAERRGPDAATDGGDATGPVGPLDAAWRRRGQSAQESVLPPGRVAVSCTAPLGHGGLGRHLQEIVEALARRGQRALRIGAAGDSCDSYDKSDPYVLCDPPAAPWTPDQLRLRAAIAAAAPLARLSPAWRTWRASVAFDVEAAGRLGEGDHLVAFNGQALAQLRAARRARWESVALVSANSHLRRVARQHSLALRRYPLERSWTGRLVARNLAEYGEADRIYVSSRYAWESFVEEGFAEETLSCFPLTPAARFRPGPEPSASATFDVVYVGALTVAKGVPLLIDAVATLPHRDLRLVLVGGAATRGMRRFVERARRLDPRIEIRPGDPLPQLRRARLCVHPAYEDGFGYAPAEALACGVPVLVSEDTGMRDLIACDGDGLVLPTDDRDALAQAIDCAYRGEILGG